MEILGRHVKIVDLNPGVLQEDSGPEGASRANDEACGGSLARD